MGTRSNVYPQSIILAKNKNNNKTILLNFFNFYNLKKLCILHGRVFVMNSPMHNYMCKNCLFSYNIYVSPAVISGILNSLNNYFTDFQKLKLESHSHLRLSSIL